MTEPEVELDELLIAAGEAPPESRIEFRDRIAAFGGTAIDRLMSANWVGDPRYAGFAIRTIQRAGAFGARSESVDALKRARTIVTRPEHESDILAALELLGEPPPRKAKSGLSHATPADVLAAPSHPRDLRLEGRYRRSELHDAGLGGSRQSGASCPAGGTYCLLFTDPDRANDHGYHDAPAGPRGYRFFGHWGGQGDMTMTHGNRQIRDRSPELYLFRSIGKGIVVFIGQFAVDDWSYEPALRDGRQVRAIVFRLERLGG